MSSKKPATTKTATSAQADLEIAKKLLPRVRKDFYSAGEVLARLDQPSVYEALGFASFAELAKKELKMSVTLATRLVSIARGMSRQLAESVGQSHAFALTRLTKEPELGKPSGTKTIVLKSGDKLRIPKAKKRAALARAAAESETERRRRATPGGTTAPVERLMTREIEATLRALGVESAKVQIRGTRPGVVANVRIQLPLSELEALCKAIPS